MRHNVVLSAYLHEVLDSSCRVEFYAHFRPRPDRFRAALKSTSAHRMDLRSTEMSVLCHFLAYSSFAVAVFKSCDSVGWIANVLPPLETCVWTICVWRYLHDFPVYQKSRRKTLGLITSLLVVRVVRSEQFMWQLPSFSFIKEPWFPTQTICCSSPFALRKQFTCLRDD